MWLHFKYGVPTATKKAKHLSLVSKRHFEILQLISYHLVTTHVHSGARYTHTIFHVDLFYLGDRVASSPGLGRLGERENVFRGQKLSRFMFFFIFIISMFLRKIAQSLFKRHPMPRLNRSRIR